METFLIIVKYLVGGYMLVLTLIGFAAAIQSGIKNKEFVGSASVGLYCLLVLIFTYLALS